MTPLRVCFFGDSFVNGTGDDACLGWVGRVCAAARRRGVDLTCYNLGVRRDTSAGVAARWRREAEARLPPEHDGRLVFSFGASDCASGGSGEGGARVALGDAVANAGAILAEARAWRPTLMLGPLPVSDDPPADLRVAALSAELAGLCAPIGVPYLDLLAVALASPTWAREAAAGDGTHPNAGGYAAVADAVERWDAWRAWADDTPFLRSPE